MCVTAEHKCRKCLVKVCNFSSKPDPDSKNEMHRVHTEDCLGRSENEEQDYIESDAEREEREYVTNDVVRKYQIEYNQSATFTPRFPEAFHQEKRSDKNCSIAFAPGEGKIPENILMTKDWDKDAFPIKHPTGEFNLHHPRKVILYDQRYFIQRIRNINPIFRNDPSYVFAASQYIEQKQLQKNINVSFMRGKKITADGGQCVYTLEDAF